MPHQINIPVCRSLGPSARRSPDRWAIKQLFPDNPTKPTVLPLHSACSHMSPFNSQFCIGPKLAACTRVKVFHQITSSKEYLLLCFFFFFFSRRCFFSPKHVSHWKDFYLSLTHTHNGLALTTELNFLVRLAHGQVSRGFSCGLGLQALVGSVLVQACCKCRSHKESVMKTSQWQSS